MVSLQSSGQASFVHDDLCASPPAGFEVSSSALRAVRVASRTGSVPGPVRGVQALSCPTAVLSDSGLQIPSSVCGRSAVCKAKLHAFVPKFRILPLSLSQCLLD